MTSLWLLGGFIILWARASVLDSLSPKKLTAWLCLAEEKGGSLSLGKDLYSPKISSLWQWRTPGCFQMASQSTYVFLILIILFNILMTSHFPFIFFSKQSHPTSLRCRITATVMALPTHLPHLFCPFLPAATKWCSLVGSKYLTLLQAEATIQVTHWHLQKHKATSQPMLLPQPMVFAFPTTLGCRDSQIYHEAKGVLPAGRETNSLLLSPYITMLDNQE